MRLRKTDKLESERSTSNADKPGFRAVYHYVKRAKKHEYEKYTV